MTDARNPPATSPRSARAALVGSLLAIILALPLAFAEYIALLVLAGLEPDPWNWAGLIAGVAMVIVGAIAIGLPIGALVLASRASGATRTSETSRTIMAARILAILALLVIIASSAFLALSVAGVCSLDGCG